MEFVQVEDLDVNGPLEGQRKHIMVSDPGSPQEVATWLFGSYTTIHQKIREVITTPSFSGGPIHGGSMNGVKASLKEFQHQVNFNESM